MGSSLIGILTFSCNSGYDDDDDDDDDHGALDWMHCTLPLLKEV